jgi:MYXO-CTERM domain-containing protein
VECRAASCTDGEAILAATCNGTGTCPASATVDCGAYACSAVVCGSACTTDAECATGHSCDAGGACVPNELGTACTDGVDCVSGICTDGVCCDTPCSGQCEACDVEGAAGRCLPVTGAPHGTRTACTAGGAEDPCQGTTCDGAARSQCSGFVAGVMCRAAACENGIAALEASCNGTGICPASTTSDCGAYACDGTVCASACTTDDQCGAGFRCDDDGACVAREGAICVDNFTLRSPDDVMVDCSPYRCEGSACLTTCVASTDCAADHYCDTLSTFQCVPFDGSTDGTGSSDDGGGSDGGCGCRMATAPSTPPALALIGLIAGALVLRRRRAA